MNEYVETKKTITQNKEEQFNRSIIPILDRFVQLHQWMNYSLALNDRVDLFTWKSLKIISGIRNNPTFM